jgi:hypothetical protein
MLEGRVVAKCSLHRFSSRPLPPSEIDLNGFNPYREPYFLLMELLYLVFKLLQEGVLGWGWGMVEFLV